MPPKCCETGIRRPLARAPAGTVRLRAIDVQMQRVFANFESAFGGDRGLPPFNGLVEELLDATALQADEVVMVAALIEFEDGFVGFKVVTDQQAGLFKLCQDAVDRCEAGVRAVLEQHPVHVFRRKVADIAFFEQFKNTQPGQGCLEAFGFQTGRGTHARTGTSNDGLRYHTPFQVMFRKVE